MMGITGLLPWNVLITAYDYFHDLYPNDDFEVSFFFFLLIFFIIIYLFIYYLFSSLF